MWDFARENPILVGVVFLFLIWSIERMVVAFIERNKPAQDCCHDEEDECEDEDEEVIASGSEEDKNA